MMSSYVPLVFGVVVGLILLASVAQAGPLDAVEPPKVNDLSVPEPSMPSMPDMPEAPDMPGMDDVPGMDGLKDGMEYMKMMSKIMNVFKKIKEWLGKVGIDIPTPGLDTIKYIAKLG